MLCIVTRGNTERNKNIIWGIASLTRDSVFHIFKRMDLEKKTKIKGTESNTELVFDRDFMFTLT